MKRLAFPLLVLLAAALTGCPTHPGNPPGASPVPGSNPFAKSTKDAGTGKPGSYRLVVTVKVTNIEVPIGTASGSEEIWSYLDEEPLQAVRSANLGRNGLRVGLGRLSAWPDLARIFKRMTGRSPKQNMVAAIPGSPLPIILKEHQDPQTIFTFHDDRTLSGCDYPPGDYLLAMVFTLDEDDPSKILLTAMPQVRTTQRRTHFVIGEDGPGVVAYPEILPFPQLTFRLRIPAESFLVIGPGANARNPTSVGHHFLVKKKQGVEFETLLMLNPEVLAAPLR
jgi:hypothetical protein